MKSDLSAICTCHIRMAMDTTVAVDIFLHLFSSKRIDSVRDRKERHTSHRFPFSKTVRTPTSSRTENTETKWNGIEAKRHSRHGDFDSQGPGSGMLCMFSDRSFVKICFYSASIRLVRFFVDARMFTHVRLHNLSNRFCLSKCGGVCAAIGMLISLYDAMRYVCACACSAIDWWSVNRYFP